MQKSLADDKANDDDYLLAIWAIIYWNVKIHSGNFAAEFPERKLWVIYRTISSNGSASCASNLLLKSTQNVVQAAQIRCGTFSIVESGLLQLNINAQLSANETLKVKDLCILISTRELS